MPALRIPKKIRGSKVLFYPKHLLPKDASRLSFLALTSPNPDVRGRGLKRILMAGKLRDAVEFARKCDFSQIPLKYFPGISRASKSFSESADWSGKLAMHQKKEQIFLHRGRPDMLFR